MDKERLWKRFRAHMGYTDAEMALFRSDPVKVKMVTESPQFVKSRIVAEVVESHNCHAGHKVRQRIVMDGNGQLVTRECPVLWMVITAFKEDADLYRTDHVPFWFYLPPTLKHLRILFSHTYFGTWLVNTLLLSVCVVLITLVTAIPAGYALSRLRLPGSGAIGTATFMTYLVPQTILFLPLARVVGTLGLYDSWWAVVVVYPPLLSRSARG